MVCIDILTIHRALYSSDMLTSIPFRNYRSESGEGSVNYTRLIWYSLEFAMTITYIYVDHQTVVKLLLVLGSQSYGCACNMSVSNWTTESKCKCVFIFLFKVVSGLRRPNLLLCSLTTIVSGHQWTDFKKGGGRFFT